jgi:transposase
LGGGTRCEPAARGHPRDGKRGLARIEYGLPTDIEGRPVAIRVLAGTTADPTAVTEAVETVRTAFGPTEMVMVGDRGMITSARIEALQALDGTGWITALRAPALAKPAAGDGPVQTSLFDTQNLAEITPTTRASAWWPAATPLWPPNAPVKGPSR